MKTNGSKQDLREHILVAARTHFAQGVAPSLAEVAQVAGVSRATLYRAFSSRAMKPEDNSMTEQQYEMSE